MGIGSIGISELVVIFIIVLVFFGPRRFPEIARSMGHAMREFRRSLNQIQRELEDADPRRSIPGRDLLGDIRSGRTGKWLDPNRSSGGAASSAPRAGTPPTRDVPESGPQRTGEDPAGEAPGSSEQIPMFDAGVESPSDAPAGAETDATKDRPAG